MENQQNPPSGESDDEFVERWTSGEDSTTAYLREQYNEQGTAGSQFVQPTAGGKRPYAPHAVNNAGEGEQAQEDPASAMVRAATSHQEREHRPGEAGSLKDDAKAIGKDQVIAGIEVAGAAATVLSDGAAAPAVEGVEAGVEAAGTKAAEGIAEKGATKAAGKAATKGVESGLEKGAEQAAKRKITEKVGQQAYEDALKRGVSEEAARAIADSAVKNASRDAATKTAGQTLKDAAKGSPEKETIDKVVGDSGKTTRAGTDATLSGRIQEALGDWEGKSNKEKLKDARKIAKNGGSTREARENNKAEAKANQGTDRAHDDRGGRERANDALAAATGISAKKAVRGVPLIGGAIEAEVDTEYRLTRQANRMMKRVVAGSVGVVAFLVIGFSLATTGAATSGAAGGAQATLGNQGTCVVAGESATADLTNLPAGPIAGYSGDQISNAAHIVIAGNKMGLSVHDQTVGVATAMGESSLKNISYGDGAINPDGSVADSIGLFQQQSNWGTTAERMDPETAAKLFFDAMVRRFPEQATRDSMDINEIAHKVQINQDPNYYTKFVSPANQMVAALTGITTSSSGGDTNTETAATTDGSATVTTATNCAPTVIGGGGSGKFIIPVKWEDFYLSSYYGNRASPGGIGSTNHKGIDMAPGCGGRAIPKPKCTSVDPEPIMAAADGKVVTADTSCSGGYGCVVKIQHQGDLSQYATLYGHMKVDSITVKVGDEVKKGQVIGIMGSTGHSTGRHLHFETWVDGVQKDPMVTLKPFGLEFEYPADLETTNFPPNA